ncbi:MAG: COG4315 family predicted lipoprotein [Acidimicrobiales bacterium]
MATTRGRCDANTTCLAGGQQGLGRHRALSISVLGAIALLAAACSSGGTSSTTGAGASTTSTGSSGSVVVKVTNVPTYGDILTTSSGMPLYTLSGSCTGSCASAWPALTVPAGTTPTGAGGVTGTLSTVKQTNGTLQVTYNGSPLYTFVSDSPGHVTGQGVSGFSVVQISGSSSSGGTTTSTTSASQY